MTEPLVIEGVMDIAVVYRGPWVIDVGNQSLISLIEDHFKGRRLSDSTDQYHDDYGRVRLTIEPLDPDERWTSESSLRSYG